MLLVIGDQPLRVISIVLLVYPLLMLAGTLGTMTEYFFGAARAVCATISDTT